MDFDALVGRIVVEVAHGHDLGGGVDFEHRVGDRTHLFGRGVALEGRCRLSAQPRGPVRDHEEEGLVVDRSPHRHDAARAPVGQRGDPHGDVGAAFEFEDIRTVEERHVHAAQVGRVVVADRITCRKELARRCDVFQDRAVLDLRDADHRRIVAVDGGDVEQHALHVAEFLVVLGRIPPLRTVGKELFVVGFGVVDGVEEVLHVVEHDLVGLLREAHHHD